MEFQHFGWTKQHGDPLPPLQSSHLRPGRLERWRRWDMSKRPGPPGTFRHTHPLFFVETSVAGRRGVSDTPTPHHVSDCPPPSPPRGTIGYTWCLRYVLSPTLAASGGGALRETIGHTRVSDSLLSGSRASGGAERFGHTSASSCVRTSLRSGVLNTGPTQEEGGPGVSERPTPETFG